MRLGLDIAQQRAVRGGGRPGPLRRRARLRRGVGFRPLQADVRRGTRRVLRGLHHAGRVGHGHRARAARVARHRPDLPPGLAARRRRSPSTTRRTVGWSSRSAPPRSRRSTTSSASSSRPPARGVDLLEDSLHVLRGLFTEDDFTYEGPPGQRARRHPGHARCRSRCPSGWARPASNGRSRSSPATPTHGMPSATSTRSVRSRSDSAAMCEDGRDPATLLRSASLSIEGSSTRPAQIDAWRDAGFGYLIVGWPSGGRAQVEEFARAVFDPTDTREATLHGSKRSGQRVVVIGGDTAGMSAASVAKRRAGDGVDVVVFERGHLTSYAMCGLPYFVAGVVPDADALVARTPSSTARKGSTSAPATRCGRSTSAPGRWRWSRSTTARSARALRPPRDRHRRGACASAVPRHRRRGCERDPLDSQRVGDRRVVVARPRRTARGGGRRRVHRARDDRGVPRPRLEVTLVEKLAQPMATLDADMAQRVTEALVALGVDVRLGVGVEGFEAGGDGWVTAVATEAGPVPADVVVLASA